MNNTNPRQLYSQIFLGLLLSASLYILTASISNGPSTFSENFLNRKALINLFTSSRLTLGDRVFSQGIAGQQNWLEYTGDRNIDDYQNTTGMSEEELRSIQQKLQKLNDELRKRNITLLVVVAPNKATIYPDKLPDEIQKIGKKSNLDLFLAYFKGHGPDIVLDLRPALLNERKKHDVYYHLDTHWNAYGAFAGYREIIKRLAKTYPELAPKNMNNFNLRVGEPYPLDIASLMGAFHLLESYTSFAPKRNIPTSIFFNNDPTIPMRVSTTQSKKLPTILMYLDSFGAGLEPMISTNFSRSTFIQRNSQYPGLLTMHTIDLIQPDIVVIEFVERTLNKNGLNEILDRLLSK